MRQRRDNFKYFTQTPNFFKILIECLSIILPIFFCPENVVCLLHLLHIPSAACIKMHFRMLNFGGNIIDPDQTAPLEQSDLRL